MVERWTKLEKFNTVVNHFLVVDNNVLELLWYVIILRQINSQKYFVCLSTETAYVVEVTFQESSLLRISCDKRATGVFLVAP